MEAPPPWTSIPGDSLPPPRPIPQGGLLPWELLSLQRQRAPGHLAARNEAGQREGRAWTGLPLARAGEGAALGEACREGGCVGPGSWKHPSPAKKQQPDSTWELVRDADSQVLLRTC